MSLDDVVKLIAQAPAVGFAVLVWWEVKGMNASMDKMASTVAVLLDRLDRSGPRA